MSTANETETLQNICATIRFETLEPAKKEAEKIIVDAEQKARDLVLKAEEKANSIILVAKNKAAYELELLQASLERAISQSVELVRQQIAEKLFNESYDKAFSSFTADPQAIAKLLDALVDSLKNVGIYGDIQASLAQKADIEAIVKLLSKETLQMLKGGKNLSIASFSKGLRIHIKDQKIMVDFSDSAIKDLMGSLVRKEYRAFLFSKEIEKKEKEL